MPFDTLEIRFSLQRLLIGLILVIVLSRVDGEAAMTLTAGVVLAIVAMHMLAN